ncbi:HEAT repeat domain-containing protein [Actinoallomurus iriomotensis]|uniref:NACHT domain-containing protein n=1 Tax=Actinoallomurus iriomotensis TaxID=478107 RepID=A0A9W6RFC3_9ACTN|nr:HEAT repeat domain-containing protein [Actinoallomurus iriomotensis]GLY75061.1 hypothetical protein Airi01_033280 [Actinoallomurus iriomotensis]
MPGLDVDRVAQIVAGEAEDPGVRGSGYLVCRRMVLTAAHVVAPDARVRVRFVADDGTTRLEPGQVVFHEEAVDVAVIRLDTGQEVEPVRYGRIPEPSPVEAVGFPRFRLRSHKDSDGRFRDTRHARGTAHPASWRREGGLEIIVDPPARDPNPRRSPWEGMSGAAIWSVGHLVGVVSEHRLGDALNTLTGSRVDRWYTELEYKRLKRLHNLIGLPLERARLTTITPHVLSLNAYLDAGVRAADEHPRPGPVAPGLREVYLPQDLRPYGLRDGSDGSLAGSLLDLDGDTVVVAGPGGGKSCMLRMLLVEGVSRWRHGHPDGEVPVLVQAADLAGPAPLPSALAAAVARDLAPFGLTAPLAGDFFQDPPRPGGRWLILVDGLDEIVDPETRRRVLRTLASASSPARRFVVCTRPLPDHELDVAGDRVRRYELRPLGADQLDEFCERWLGATGAADPAAAARSFTTALDRAGVRGLARTPLMATMLLGLHVSDSSAPLPTGRSGVFARFVELLSERFHARGPGGIHAQTRAALERYGPEVLRAAETAVARIPDVVEELAARQNRADDVNAARFVAAALVRPEPVAEAVWDDFVRDAVRRTGLLVGDDLRFSHRTLVEFLAARHVAKDEAAHAAALREELAAVQRRIRATGYLSVPAAAPEASYLGFLLDARETPRSAVRTLNHLATGRSLQGCEFIADLARLGTALPPRTVHEASRNLRRLVRRKRAYSLMHRARAAAALAELGGDGASDALADMYAEPDGLGPRGRKTVDDEWRFSDAIRCFGSELPRGFIALRLAERGDPRGVPLLMAMTRDTYLLPFTRVHSAGALADLGHPDAGEVLHGLATDPTIDNTHRALAARLLGVKLDDRRAVSVLLAMARDEDLPPFVRMRAAFGLARLGENRGVSILVAATRRKTVQEAPLPGYSKLQAARYLARLGDRRALGILDAVSRDDTVAPLVRRRAGTVRKRVAARNYFDLPLEQRVVDELTGGRVRRRLVPLLARPAWVLLPFFIRRYGRDIDAMFDDAGPADVPEDAGGANEHAISR